MRIIVADTLSVQTGGSITSTCVFTSQHVSAGSGGSVWITAAKLNGGGVITATGCQQTHTGRSPGAGGRVAVYATTSAATFSGTIQALGGGVANGASFVARPGTVYLALAGINDSPDWVVPAGAQLLHVYSPTPPLALNSITVDAGATLGFVTNVDAATVVNVTAGATLTTASLLDDPEWELNVAGSLHLGTGAVLGSQQRDVTLTLPSSALRLEDGSGIAVEGAGITVAAASGVSVLDATTLSAGTFVKLATSQGDILVERDATIVATTYTTGLVDMSAAEQGQGQGGAIEVFGTVSGAHIASWSQSMWLRNTGALSTVDTSQDLTGRDTGRIGAVHGGEVPTNIKAAFGSVTAPVHVGTMGGIWNRLGPGAVKVVVNGTLKLDAAALITSKGDQTGDTRWGGPSGGSVWLDVAKLEGAGTIIADGGPVCSSALLNVVVPATDT